MADNPGADAPGMRRRLGRLLLRIRNRVHTNRQPPVPLSITGTAPETWLIDVVGEERRRLPDVLARITDWRDSLAPDTSLVVLADEDAVDALTGAGVTVVTATTDEDRRRLVAAVGASRTISVRSLTRIGEPVGLRMEPVPDPPDPGSWPMGPPIFVGGTGRSGTWALGRLLENDPGITTVRTEVRFHTTDLFPAVLEGRMTPEVFTDEVMSRWYRVVGGGGNPKGLQLLVSRRELQSALRRYGGTVAHDAPRALRRLMRDVIEPHARGRGATRWVETTPANIAAAATLVRVFPHAKMVHMVRDGRDVAASVARMPWGPDAIEDALEWWGRRMRAAQLGMVGVPRGHMLVVRLEELVHLDRRRVFAEVTGFLDVAADGAVAEFFEAGMNATRGNLGRWRTEVPDDRRRSLDDRYRELLDELSTVGVPCPPVSPDLVDELADEPSDG